MDILLLWQHGGIMAQRDPKEKAKEEKGNKYCTTRHLLLASSLDLGLKLEKIFSYSSSIRRTSGDPWGVHIRRRFERGT